MVVVRLTPLEATPPAPAVPEVPLNPLVPVSNAGVDHVDPGPPETVYIFLLI